jgi:hypothetical protein
MGPIVPGKIGGNEQSKTYSLRTNFEDEAASLGEGSNIVVVAYLIAVRKELGGESCNCGLHTEAQTDNHLVLVKKSTVDQMPLSGTTKAEIAATEKQREAQSTTAEFTPRVRLSQPNFTYETMQPLIVDTPQKALWVRVTGQLMFDSEHFLHNQLDRVNNWEIHPVMKMEYCTQPALIARLVAMRVGNQLTNPFATSSVGSGSSTATHRRLEANNPLASVNFPNTTFAIPLYKGHLQHKHASIVCMGVPDVRP